MRKLCTIFLVVTLTSGLFAQSPQKMSYQAVIRNSGDALVTTQVGLKISILHGASDGIEVYTETQTPTQNSNGLITIEIGNGNPGVFAAINWSDGPYFIKTEIAVEAPLTTYTITGTSQLLSVPYALYAKTSETALDAVRITGDQTISGIKTFSGTINANDKNITNVATPISATDAATKAYVDVLLQRIDQLESQPGVVKDYDGNLYTTVKIGNQVWMAENLKTTRYNNGTTIPIVLDNASWSNLITPGYCWYNNDEATYKASYGALYNWHTVSAGNLCPTGWHVPGNDEWTTLTDYLGGLSVAGGRIKETGTVHWDSPNTGATNESGFTALPGGYRNYDGIFYISGNAGFWWSASEGDATQALYRYVYSNPSNVISSSTQKKDGFSVRCVRDN